MKALALFFLPLWAFGASSHASTCAALQAQIEAKIRSAGVARFSLVAVDAGAAAPGRVVGTCDRGSKKIVYSQSAPSSADANKTDAIITECKDGSVPVGGVCKKR